MYAQYHTRNYSYSLWHHMINLKTFLVDSSGHRTMNFTVKTPDFIGSLTNLEDLQDSLTIGSHSYHTIVSNMQMLCSRSYHHVPFFHVQSNCLIQFTCEQIKMIYMP
jgi:hypothetical protein